MPTPEPPASALTAQEVAKQLKVSYRTVLNLAQSGDLSYFLVNNQYRFTQADVDQYIADHRGGGKR